MEVYGDTEEVTYEDGAGPSLPDIEAPDLSGLPWNIILPALGLAFCCCLCMIFCVICLISGTVCGIKLYGPIKEKLAQRRLRKMNETMECEESHDLKPKPIDPDFKPVTYGTDKKEYKFDDSDDVIGQVDLFKNYSNKDQEEQRNKERENKKFLCGLCRGRFPAHVLPPRCKKWTAHVQPFQVDTQRKQNCEKQTKKNNFSVGALLRYRIYRVGQQNDGVLPLNEGEPFAPPRWRDPSSA